LKKLKRGGGVSSRAGNSLRAERKGEGSPGQWDIRLGRGLSEVGELPAPPAHVIQLNAILTATPVDLKRLGRVLDSDPTLAGQVIKLCNSSLFNLPNPVSSLEQAVLILGTDHLRILVLTCALVESVGNLVCPREQYCFWERGFLAAAVSEGLARRTGYTEIELAYFGGLLHDLGTLPQLCTESQERSRPGGARHSMEPGEALAGVDHCQLGRRLGILWGFPLPLLEVFEFHHEPQKAREYKTLVGIVALAEQFCRVQCLVRNEKSQAGANRNLPCALVPDAPLAAQQGLAEGMGLDYRRMSERLKAGLGEAFVR
jgi:HD-like signal output (HDOD) protein